MRYKKIKTGSGKRLPVRSTQARNPLRGTVLIDATSSFHVSQDGGLVERKVGLSQPVVGFDPEVLVLAG